MTSDDGPAPWSDYTLELPLGPLAGSVARLPAQTPGPAVLLLHSLGLGRDSWRPTALALASSGLVAHALDLPGHGDSPGPRQMLTIEDYALVVRDAIDELGLGPVHLVGNSFGSIVAAEAAARFPEHAASLVLVGCPAWPSRAERAAWLHARSQVLLTDGGEAVTVTRDLVATMFPEVRDEYVGTVAAGFAQAGTWIRNVMWALYAYDGAPAFAELPQPTLVVYGEHDWLQATSGHLLSLLRNGTRATIAGGAHMTPVNRPQELAAVIAGHVHRVPLEAA
jgi:pimeloyl-ACP methyl ester carboxylesterase